MSCITFIHFILTEQPRLRTVVSLSKCFICIGTASVGKVPQKWWLIAGTAPRGKVPRVGWDVKAGEGQVKKLLIFRLGRFDGG